MIYSENIYRKLREEINKMPIPFSETASGAELRLLKLLFTPEEAEIAIHLNIMPETIARIHKRARKSGRPMPIISISPQAMPHRPAADRQIFRRRLPEQIHVFLGPDIVQIAGFGHVDRSISF